MVSALHLGGADTTADAAGPPFAEVRFTGRADGDMADPSGSDRVVTNRRRAIVDRPWTWLHQVHGAGVVCVQVPGGCAGGVADGAVSAVPGVALCILTADCCPVALLGSNGVIGAAHAGWRGLRDGVIDATVAGMRRLGAERIIAALGPCIHPECYRFGPAELDELVARFGPEVGGQDRDGAPALDLPATVRMALAQAGAELVWDADICTGCSSEHWSWRARQDRQRQAMVVWSP